MKAVRYDRFSGIDGIYLADVPEPVASPGEVVVRVEAGALNPGALPALHGSSYTPGRDLAGEVVAVGAGVLGFTVGDAVLGRLQSWDAHAQFVAIPAVQLVSKPQALSWDVAGSLCTTPMAGLGAVRAVAPRPGETIELILDDHRIAKRGKKMDRLSKIWDHKEQKFVHGHIVLFAAVCFRGVVMPLRLHLWKPKDNSKGSGVFDRIDPLPPARTRR